ncbi:MAG: hypothetical protein JXA30_01665 [Deltaproteobacteria bacterium]|nr:hypothetical protein [Deltaproteobacteria bacterium]
MFLGSCDSCGGDTTVPFKREVSSKKMQKGEPENKAEMAAASTDPSRLLETASARSYPQDTREVTLGEARLETPDGSIRAVFGFDLDSDGDEDALLVATDSEGNLILRKAERSTGGFQAVDDRLKLWPAVASCQTDSVTIGQLGASYAEISATFGCEAWNQEVGDSESRETIDKQRELQQAAAAQLARGVAQRAFWIITLEAAPRLLEHVALRQPDETRAPDKIDLRFSSRDLDSDGHDDVEMTIDLSREDEGEKNTVLFSWLNRPSGLARDLSQPEGLFLSLADQARNMLNKNPDGALKRAERVQEVYDALCRQGGASRLLISGVSGFDCDGSTALGRAKAVALAAWARKGDVMRALATYRSLKNASLQLSSRDRKLVDTALKSIPSATQVIWQLGPEHRPQAGPEVRLPSVAFVDENTLLLRGSTPRFFNLEEQSLTEGEPGTAHTLIEDHSRRFAVVSLAQSCLGYHLRIVNASQARAGVYTGPAVSEPLIESRSALPGTACSTSPVEIHNGDSDYRVLGWNPQGIVVTEGTRLLLVRVDEDAQPSGESVNITDPRALAAPLSPGASTPDGRTYGVITPIGIVLQSVLPSPKTSLLRPPEWKAEETSDLALAPSGRKLAFIAASRVYIGKW